MFHIGNHLLIGIGTAVLCLFGLWQARWLLTETPKGQRFANWLGEPQALRVLQVCLLAGVAFGTLLACQIIRPVQW